MIIKNVLFAKVRVKKKILKAIGSCIIASHVMNIIVMIAMDIHSKNL